MKKVLGFKTTLGETLIFGFIAGGAAVFLPDAVAQFNAGFNLAASTWIMIVAIAALAGALLGIVASLRLTREVTLQFERLSFELFRRIDQVTPQRINVDGLRDRTSHLVQHFSQRQDRRDTELLATGILWMLQSPVTTEVVMPGCCPYCHKFNEEWLHIADTQDPRYFEAKHHNSDCAVPPVYKWSQDLLTQIRAQEERSHQKAVELVP